MSRIVYCQHLNKEAEGLEFVPMPGDLGIRIYENISNEGWTKWLERLTSIINENGLNTADPASIQIIEQHMLGFLFKEGEMGSLPEGFQAKGGK